MSYETMINDLKVKLEAHQLAVPAGQEGHIEDVDAVIASVKGMGGFIDLDTLMTATPNELKDCGVPLGIAKAVVKSWQQADAQLDQRPVISRKVLRTMRAPQLLEHYDPDAAEDDQVTERLRKLSRGERCIVFKPDGSINVTESAKLFADIHNGQGGREIVMVDSVPCQVYRVGETRNNIVDENPLWPGEPLRSGETCDHTNRSWEGVSLTVRQLLYIAVNETRELRIDSIDRAHDTILLALGENAEANIRQRYQQASVSFDEHRDAGDLPTLKLQLSSSAASGSGSQGSNMPFGGRNRVR